MKISFPLKNRIGRQSQSFGAKASSKNETTVADAGSVRHVADAASIGGKFSLADRLKPIGLGANRPISETLRSDTPTDTDTAGIHRILLVYEQAAHTDVFVRRS